MTKELRIAKELLKRLNFEDCIDLYQRMKNKYGPHPLIDPIFDRMEEIDLVRFDAWLDDDSNFA